MSLLTKDSRGRRAGMLAVVAVLVAVLTGCGGADDDDLSVREFIAEADAICARHAADSGELERQFNQALLGGDLEGAAEGFEAQATEVSAMLDELEALTVPVADQTTVARMIELGRQRVQIARQGSAAIAQGDKDAMIAAGKEASVLAGEYFQLTDGFGFEACGSGGPAAPDGPVSRTGTTTP